jgi:hypothetical protein
MLGIILGIAAAAAFVGFAISWVITVLKSKNK